MSCFKLFLLLLLHTCLPLFSEEQSSTEKKPVSAATKLDKETLSEMERLRAEPKISSEFSRGSFLIYDCRQRYYACVNSVSFERCKVMRNTGYQNKKMMLPCAPLKEFDNQELCSKKQYSLIHNQNEKGFCQNTKNARY